MRGENPQQKRMDSSSEYQEEVQVVRMIERGENRATAVKNKEAADMQAWRRAKSDTYARKRTMLAKLRLYSESLPKNKFRGDTKESLKDQAHRVTKEKGTNKSI